MINLDLINEMVAGGYINKQTHPQGELFLYNYTPKAQFDRVWNDATKACRGLILDENGEIVARPFPKFFNLEEHSRSDITFSKPFSITDKMDGSLGIMYMGPDGPAIATRGSFTSEQAIWASDILAHKYPAFVLATEAAAHLSQHGRLEETWLFEIIYPHNRIVVNYGDMEDLVLLAVIDNKTGRDLYPDLRETDWEGPIVKSYDISCKPRDVVRSLKPTDDGDTEGYVLRFDWPKEGPQARVKIKLDEYKRLHRILTCVSNVNIWEYLRTGQPLDEIIERVPDEFYQWVKDTVADLKEKFNAIFADAIDELADIVHQIMNIGIDDDDWWMSPELMQVVREAKRKEFAELALKSDLRSVLFCMLDGDKAKVDQVIWKMIRPTYSKPFHKDIDA